MSILKLKNGNTWESVTVIKGDKGDTGDDGFSPVVEVEEITGGHTVTITDAEGDHSFNVMDGSGYTETDPTVPSWAKASSKPTYTASEVGALPSSTFIPSKTSDLTNDSGFITGEYVAPYEELTANISMTTGTLISYVCYRFGHVYYLKIEFQSSGTVAPGANLAAGSVTLPNGSIQSTTGCSYYGANAIVLMMWGTGTDSASFVIRHAGTANITMTGQSRGTVTVTWIA